MTKNIRLALLVLSALAMAASFWLFSRFTVDDGFITWRYGKNLYDFGIWNYNPSVIDLTQSYTNPIYALLSIVPAYLNIDAVLFFKLFSSIVLIVFFAYFYSKTKSLLMILIAYAVPATFIHAFSGLETFLFVALLVALFISMDENKPKVSTLITIILMLTRPEAWLLSLMVPLFYLIRSQIDNFKSIKELTISSLFKNLFSFSDYKHTYIKSTGVLIALISFLAAYFIIHKILFGFALPNTFYIKAGSSISPALFIFIAISIAPLCVLIASKRLSLLLLFGGFFLIVGFQYTTSDLQMNYTERFLFHIAMPIYFILVYVASKNDSINLLVSDENNSFNIKLNSKQYVNFTALILLSLITLKTLNAGGLAHIATYYPRALDSHAELGKTLNKLKLEDKVDAFSLGDAGMAAYHSQLNALDNIGLGSSLLAQKGFNKELIDLYNPKVVVFHAQPSGIRLDTYNQSILKEWVDEKNYIYVCDIYWQPDYTLKVYADKAYTEIKNTCLSSKLKNNINNSEYVKSSLLKSPISYWHD